MILMQVKLIDFSPGEKYLVTYSSHEPSNPRDANVRFSNQSLLHDFILLLSNVISDINLIYVEGCDKHF